MKKFYALEVTYTRVNTLVFDSDTDRMNWALEIADYGDDHPVVALDIDDTGLINAYSIP